MDIPVIYEDEDLLVINKPPGVVVNRAESVKEETIQDWAEDKLNQLNKLNQLTDEDKEFKDRAGIVHRIDKETSGLLLIAKTPQVFSELQRQFKERLVKKTYVAIAHGKLAPQTGEIRAPVGRLPWNKERFGIVPGGKESVTRYKIIKLLACDLAKHQKEDLSLVELYPETGRTHQIRVHLKYINHPILGDYLYAGRKVARNDRVWAPRVMLHAAKISFIHPRLQTEVDYLAPIPEDMERILNKSAVIEQ